MNYQFQYVFLYISGTVDHIIEILITISTGIFLYLNLKNATLWILKLSCFFCVSRSSINAKKKFWGVPHLLHMCVIFFQTESIDHPLTALNEMVFIMGNIWSLPPSIKLSCRGWLRVRVLVINFWKGGRKVWATKVRRNTRINY